MLTAWKPAALKFHKQLGLSAIIHLAIFLQEFPSQGWPENDARLRHFHFLHKRQFISCLAYKITILCSLESQTAEKSGKTETLYF